MSINYDKKIANNAILLVKRWAKDVVIENCIIAEASPDISILTQDCELNYCCIENGCENANAVLTGCITSDPDFVAVGSDDYHILWDSPCIDTGVTNAGEVDDYSPADMGSYPYEKYYWQVIRHLEINEIIKLVIACKKAVRDEICLSKHDFFTFS